MRKLVEKFSMTYDNDIIIMIIVTIIVMMITMAIKMAIYCPQGSGTLRQQLLMMH